jgi:hypothetical protein
MCDVDSVEICMNKGCWKPLAIIEHLYDLNQTKKKYTTIVEHIGRALKVPVFLVYYKKSTRDTLSFRVAQKHPIRTPLTPHCEAEWVDILRSIQLKHQKVCKYAKVELFYISLINLWTLRQVIWGEKIPCTKLLSIFNETRLEKK